MVTEIGVSADRVAVIPNAVPAPPQKRQAAVSNCPVQILFRGNPSRRKGLHDLIAALAMDPLRKPGMAYERGRRRKPSIGTFRESSRAAGLSDRNNLHGLGRSQHNRCSFEFRRYNRAAVLRGRHGDVDTGGDVRWIMHSLYPSRQPQGGDRG